MKNSIKIVLYFLLMIPFITNAVVVNQSIGGDVGFNLEPENPGSLTNVKVSAISYYDDLDRAYISWYLNGVLALEGPAQKDFNFQTEKSGKITNIKMLAVVDGKNIEKTMSINPADVDIVWEADTYVPPAYKGKALASPRSSVKLFALPHFISDKGNLIQPEDLVYEWSDNYAKIRSGLSKNSAKITMGTPLGENTVSVKVSTQKGDITAEKELKIIPENVFINFYEDKPLDGTNYNSALIGTANFSDKENSVRAEPYFFSYPDSASDMNLTFNWTLNGKGVTPNEGTPKIITLRNESGSETISSLGLTISNIKRIFQDISAEILIKSVPGTFNF